MRLITHHGFNNKLVTRTSVSPLNIAAVIIMIAAINTLNTGVKKELPRLNTSTMLMEIDAHGQMLPTVNQMTSTVVKLLNLEFLPHGMMEFLSAAPLPHLINLRIKLLDLFILIQLMELLSTIHLQNVVLVA